MKKPILLLIWSIFAGLFVISGCATLPDNTDRPVSQAYTDTAHTYFGRDIAADLAAHQGSSKASLHTKSFVFDRKQVFIGSLNLDPRSVVENTEIGGVISSAEMAREMSTWFDENIEKVAFRLELQKSKSGSEKLLWHGLESGTPRTLTVEPYTSLRRRLSVGFMRLLPIESQL